MERSKPDGEIIAAREEKRQSSQRHSRRSASLKQMLRSRLFKIATNRSIISSSLRSLYESEERRRKSLVSAFCPSVEDRFQTSRDPPPPPPLPDVPLALCLAPCRLLAGSPLPSSARRLFAEAVVGTFLILPLASLSFFFFFFPRCSLILVLSRRSLFGVSVTGYPGAGCVN